MGNRRGGALRGGGSNGEMEERGKIEEEDLTRAVEGGGKLASLGQKKRKRRKGAFLESSQGKGRKEGGGEGKRTRLFFPKPVPSFVPWVALLYSPPLPPPLGLSLSLSSSHLTFSSLSPQHRRRRVCRSVCARQSLHTHRLNTHTHTHILARSRCTHRTHYHRIIIIVGRWLLSLPCCFSPAAVISLICSRWRKGKERRKR